MTEENRRWIQDVDMAIPKKCTKNHRKHARGIELTQKKGIKATRLLAKRKEGGMGTPLASKAEELRDSKSLVAKKEIKAAKGRATKNASRRGRGPPRKRPKIESAPYPRNSKQELLVRSSSSRERLYPVRRAPQSR